MIVLMSNANQKLMPPKPVLACLLVMDSDGRVKK